MYLWKIVSRFISSPDKVDNPVFSDVMRLQSYEHVYQFNVFMKAKPKCEYYENFIDVPVWKYFELQKMFSVEKEPTLHEVVQAVHILTGLEYKKILKMRMYEVCRNYSFIIKGLDDITDKVKFLNSSKPNSKQVRAGIENLNKFGVMNSIKMVADYYNITLEDAEQRPYRDCYAVWLYNKEKCDYEIAYQKINSPIK